MEPIVYVGAGVVGGLLMGLALHLVYRARHDTLMRELSWIADGLKLVLGMSEERCQQAFHWSKEKAITKYMQRLERLIPYEYMRRFEYVDPSDAVSSTRRTTKGPPEGDTR